MNVVKHLCSQSQRFTAVFTLKQKALKAEAGIRGIYSKGSSFTCLYLQRIFYIVYQLLDVSFRLAYLLFYMLHNLQLVLKRKRVAAKLV